jgi:rhodanese-related sulfurtransferase
MNPCLPGAALAALLLAGAPLPAPAAEAEPFQMIPVDEVERMLGQPDVVVLDANNRDLFEKHHLPGARFITSKTLAEALPKDKAARLVFYCASPT